MPSAVSVAPLIVADVAEPPASVTSPPTCVPPVGQPAAVTSLGPQRKKLTVPVGVPLLATASTVATSCCAAPGAFSLPPGVAVVVIGGFTHVLN